MSSVSLLPMSSVHTNRGFGDYGNDLHYSSSSGAYAQYTFVGTGVRYVTETYPDRGNVDVYLDGIYQTTVNCYSASLNVQQVMYSAIGLPLNSHTIKIVKNGGALLGLDAFDITSAPTAVADLKFDETSGATAFDSTGNGWNGTLVGGSTWAAGKVNNAVSLSGSGNYVSLPSGIVNGLTDFTISAWVKLNDLQTGERIFDFGTGITNTMYLTPSSSTAHLMRFGITTSGSAGEQRIDSTVVSSTGTWMHVAVTLSGSTGTLYLNGTAVGTNSAMTLTPTSLGVTTQNTIGKSQSGADPYLNGMVDEFQIIPGALCASEVAQLASSPAAPNPIAAAPGNAQVTVTWPAVAGATSYNVKRAIVSGGPYVTVAVVSGTSDLDTWLVNNTTYYYVVTAVNVLGESGNSPEASATPIPPPTITSAASVTGTNGAAFSYQLAGTNNPTGFSASGLPTGLSLNTSTGLISGLPSVSGTFTVAIGMSNAGGLASGVLTITLITVTPIINGPLSVTGTNGHAFSYQIPTNVIPASYSASGLPSGLSLNTGSGLISGTPTATGTFTSTVGAINTSGTASATLTVTVVLAPPIIVSGTSATGVIGTSFSYQIAAINAPASYAASGLPDGLSVDPGAGLISGTPAATGTFSAIVSAINASGTGSAGLTITVVSTGGSFTWADSAGNSAWSGGSSWAGGVAPPSNTTSGTALFTSVNNSQPVMDAGSFIAGIDFQLAAGGLNFTGSSATLTLGAAGIDASTQLSGTSTVAVGGLVYSTNAPSAWTLFSNAISSGTSVFNITSNLVLNTASSFAIQSNRASTGGSGIVNLSGVISGSIGAGLSFSGASGSTNTINLAGISSYAATTNITAVALTANSLAVAGSNSALGSSGQVNVGTDANAARLTFQNLAGSCTTNRLFSFNGIGVNAYTLSNNDPVSTISFTNTGTFGAASTATNFSFVLGGSNGGANAFGETIVDRSGGGITLLTKNGTGAWMLTGSNSYSGGTTVNAGSLRTSNGSAFGPTAITVGSGANLWLNPTETSSGTTTISNVITLGNGAAIYAGPASYTIAGESGYKTQGPVILNNPVLISGTATFGSSARTHLTFSGAVTGSGGVNVTVVPGAMASGYSPNYNPGFSSIYLTSTANNWTGGTVIGRGNGGFYGGSNDANWVYAASLGSGPIQLGMAASGYSGQAFLTLTASNAINPGSTVTLIDVTNGAYYSQLDLNGYSQTISGLISAGGGGTGGQYCRVLSGSGAPTLTIAVASGTSYTFNGTLSSALNLVKSGSGTQIFSGTNTYTGNTTISAGTLQLNAASLANGANVLLSTGATLNLNFTGSDVVNALFIDGARMPSGKWGPIGSIVALGADYESALITGSGLLAVTTGPWEFWQQSQFGANASNPVIAGDQADPDHDGVPNLLEYALGNNPNLADAGSHIVRDIEQLGGQSYLRITVTKNPAATDIQWSGEANNDLTNAAGWSSAGTTVETDNVSQFVVRDNTPLGGTTRHFLRLKVIRLP